MRRTRTALIALTFAALFLPAASDAASVPVKFQATTYSGDYTFNDTAVTNFTYPEPHTETSTQKEQFHWVVVSQKEFRRDGSRRITTLYDGQGAYSGHFPSVEPPDVSCLYETDRSPVVESHRIAYLEARPKPDPQVLVEWQLPVLSPVFMSSGSGCNGRKPTNGRPIFFDFQGTEAYKEAFLSSVFTTLSKLPYTRSLGDTLSGDYDDHNGTTEHAVATVTAKVTSFALGADFSLRKLRDLARDDALNIVGSTTDSGSSFGQGRPQEVLIIPRPEPGQVRIKIFGKGELVIPISRVHASRASSTLLASGSHKVKAGKAFRLTLTPTADGQAFLSHPHPETEVTVKVTFDPKGKRRAVTATQSGKLPAG